METSTSSVHDKPIRYNLTNNPIITKELKGRMRGWQGFVMLTAYLVLISLVIACAYSL